MLIRTKLNVPPIRTLLLDRPRLVRRTRNGSDRRLTLISLGNQKEALSVLSKVVECARTEGYVRPFVEHASHVCELLRGLSDCKEGPLRGYVRTLLKACSVPRAGSPAMTRVRIDDVEFLTPREAEILRMITAGMTNREIAENTFVSVNTIKTHIRHIFGKLGAKDRKEAILKSRQLDGF